MLSTSAIAAAAVALLVPYLQKAGEEFAKKAGQAAWEKAAEVQKAIKARFAKEKDRYPAETLKRFEEKPEARQAAMQEALEGVLNEDHEFARTLLQLLKEADAAGAGTVFNVNIFGGQVGEIINVDQLEGGLTIRKQR